jgi:predicted amidohydrolase
MSKKVNVAVIQTKVPKTYKEAEKNIDRLLNEAIQKQVDIVGLPEDCLASYEEIGAGYRPFDFLSEVSRKYNTFLFGANILKEDDGKFYNCGFIFDNTGKLILKHHKIVLTPISKLTHGNSLEVVDTPIGKLSMLICRDAMNKYSPWFFNELRNAGVELLLVPSLSINVTRSDIDISLWVDSLKAQYNWFFMPIAGSGTIGENFTPFPSFGHAMIIGNGGETVMGSEDKEEILYLTIDLEKLREVRETVENDWAEKDIPEFKLVKLN